MVSLSLKKQLDTAILANNDKPFIYFNVMAENQKKMANCDNLV